MLDIGVPGVGSIFVSVALVLIFLRDLSLLELGLGVAGRTRGRGCSLCSSPSSPTPSISAAIISSLEEASNHFAWR